MGKRLALLEAKRLISRIIQLVIQPFVKQSSVHLKIADRRLVINVVFAGLEGFCLKTKALHNALYIIGPFGVD